MSTKEFSVPKSAPNHENVLKEKDDPDKDMIGGSGAVALIRQMKLLNETSCV